MDCCYQAALSIATAFFSGPSSSSPSLQSSVTIYVDDLSSMASFVLSFLFLIFSVFFFFSSHMQCNLQQSPNKKMYTSITTSLDHHVTFVIPPQSYCSRLVIDGTSAWAELVLWTFGRQSGHNSVSISLCWIELTSSKFEIFGSSVREPGGTQSILRTRVY